MCIEVQEQWPEAAIIAAHYQQAYGRVPPHIRRHLQRPCGRCGIEVPDGAVGDLCPECLAASRPLPHDPGE